MNELIDFDDDLSEKDIEKSEIENELLEEAILQLLTAIGKTRNARD